MYQSSDGIASPFRGLPPAATGTLRRLAWEFGGSADRPKPAFDDPAALDAWPRRQICLEPLGLSHTPMSDMGKISDVVYAHVRDFLTTILGIGSAGADAERHIMYSVEQVAPNTH